MTEASPVINPYIAGNPVTGQEMFFGREDVFGFIRQTLIGRHQDNIIVLHGQRRTGKTSVLYQMHRQIDPRYIPVLIDLQALSMDGLATFLWEISASISRTLRRNQDILVERPRQEDFAANPREFFEVTFLNQVWDAIGDRHLLLMFDESVRLEEQVLAGRLEHEVFGYLRHLMQHNERLNFIFSLGSRLEEMQRDYAVLFNVALYKKISFLEPDAARLLITTPAEGVFEYDDQAVDYIMELGGRQTYYTQLICHSLFSRFAGEWSVITEEDVRSVLMEVVERGAANLKFVWDQADTIEKLVLTAMAEIMSDENRPVTDRQIQRALRDRQITLSTGEVNTALRGLVYREVLLLEEGYKFSVDLQRLYLRESQRIEWVQEELSNALEETRVAHAIVAKPAKRTALVRVLAIAGSAFVVGTVLGALLVPASPLYMMGTSPTPTILPSATPTPVPPATGVYLFERCGIELEASSEEPLARLKLCVESVEVSQEGIMQFNVSWTAEIKENLVDASGRPLNALKKDSDEGNTNMYVTDDRGNRYDFTDLGGAARETTIIQNGEKATGWFLFPPPRKNARLFTFHDDDHFWAIAGIILEQ
ncbi:MAG: ATP-binding protein [Dehalococcoidia bacterium]